MNSAFPVFALLLWAAAAALLIWLPRIWRRGDAPETNEDWLRLRQRELAGEAEAAQLHEEAALSYSISGRRGPSGDQSVHRIPVAAACCVALVALGLDNVSIAAVEDVQIAEQLGQIEQSQPQRVSAH